MMILKYNNKEIVLYKCNSFFSRLKGFMFKKNIDCALLFDRCNSIHTFFMYKNIDVILCSKDNTILYYYCNLERNRIVLPKKGVCKVYEMPSNYFNVKVGDVMEVIE